MSEIDRGPHGDGEGRWLVLVHDPRTGAVTERHGFHVRHRADRAYARLSASPRPAGAFVGLIDTRPSWKVLRTNAPPSDDFFTPAGYD